MYKRIAACLLAAVILIYIIALNRDYSQYTQDCIYLNESAQGDGIEAQLIYEELFNINSTVKIDIGISKDELAKIQNDYNYYSSGKSPVYRRADYVIFNINGKKYIIEDVGIRMKGSSSLNNFYNDLLGVYNIMNFKLSFNETFDDGHYSTDATRWQSDEQRNKRLNRRFATLEKMDIKWNMQYDNTYTRTVYAHSVFNSCGIVAQKCTVAAVSMGGNKMGIYKVYEPVDEIFINRNFPPEDRGGDLYKCHWVGYDPVDYQLDNTIGIAKRSAGNFYHFELKTNEDTSDFSSIKNLLEVVNRENVTRSQLEEVIDMQQFLRFSAISYALGCQDDMRHNCNNHYVYFRKSDGKAIFIPYDVEFCLGVTYHYNPSGNGMTDVSPYTDLCLGTNDRQHNPLILATLTEHGLYKEEYTEQLREISESVWMNEEKFISYYEKMYSHYHSEIISNNMYCSTMGHNIEFSLEGGENYNDNMSIKDYFDGKNKAFKKYLQ